ncbi:glycosyltransferase family 1 protein [Faecalibaculum rodentium]|uniref:glycosyltransferase family 1 protein n=1 Tax=Faecalibaculum rodentium TaxID=1702221 RepID=UPI0023F12E65|nr:glycosyltransferase family 1 protein [Faecalibaculum rodentium]
MVRVIHFQLDSNIGGIETFLLNVYKKIDRNKYHFDFITQSANPAFAKEFKKLGANIYQISSPKKLLSYIRDINQVFDNNYDVIHFHKNSAANIIPIILATKKNLSKIVIHSHNTAPSVLGITSYLHKVNRHYLVNHANYRIACSDLAGKWLFGSKEKYEVIPNGIDINKFKFNNSIRNGMRRSIGIPEDAFVIGHIGRFSSQKNQDFLVKIFHKIKEIRDISVLILIGDGELRGEVEKEVVSLGLEDSVLFLGTRTDIPELLSTMDVFLMPSIYEGLPIVGVEAQASGLSLYLSDTISRELVLSDSVNWFSLDSNPSDIAKIIARDQINETIRKQRWLQVVSSGYDIEQTVFKMSDIYDSLTLLMTKQ